MLILTADTTSHRGDGIIKNKNSSNVDKRSFKN